MPLPETTGEPVDAPLGSAPEEKPAARIQVVVGNDNGLDVPALPPLLQKTMAKRFSQKKKAQSNTYLSIPDEEWPEFVRKSWGPLWYLMIIFGITISQTKWLQKVKPLLYLPRVLTVLMFLYRVAFGLVQLIGGSQGFYSWIVFFWGYTLSLMCWVIAVMRFQPTPGSIFSSAMKNLFACGLDGATQRVAYNRLRHVIHVNRVHFYYSIIMLGVGTLVWSGYRVVNVIGGDPPQTDWPHLILYEPIGPIYVVWLIVSDWYIFGAGTTYGFMLSTLIWINAYALEVHLPQAKEFSEGMDGDMPLFLWYEQDHAAAAVPSINMEDGKGYGNGTALPVLPSPLVSSSVHRDSAQEKLGKVKQKLLSYNQLRRSAIRTLKVTTPFVIYAAIFGLVTEALGTIFYVQSQGTDPNLIALLGAPFILCVASAIWVNVWRLMLPLNASSIQLNYTFEPEEERRTRELLEVTDAAPTARTLVHERIDKGISDIKELDELEQSLGLPQLKRKLSTNNVPSLESEDPASTPTTTTANTTTTGANTLSGDRATARRKSNQLETARDELAATLPLQWPVGKGTQRKGLRRTTSGAGSDVSQDSGSDNPRAILRRTSSVSSNGSHHHSDGDNDGLSDGEFDDGLEKELMQEKDFTPARMMLIQLIITSFTMAAASAAILLPFLLVQPKLNYSAVSVSFLPQPGDRTSATFWAYYLLRCLVRIPLVNVVPFLPVLVTMSWKKTVPRVVKLYMVFHLAVTIIYSLVIVVTVDDLDAGANRFLLSGPLYAFSVISVIVVGVNMSNQPGVDKGWKWTYFVFMAVVYAVIFVYSLYIIPYYLGADDDNTRVFVRLALHIPMSAFAGYSVRLPCYWMENSEAASNSFVLPGTLELALQVLGRVFFVNIQSFGKQVQLMMLIGTLNLSRRVAVHLGSLLAQSWQRAGRIRIPTMHDLRMYLTSYKQHQWHVHRTLQSMLYEYLSIFFALLIAIATTVAHSTSSVDILLRMVVSAAAQLVLEILFDTIALRVEVLSLNLPSVTMWDLKWSRYFTVGGVVAAVTALHFSDSIIALVYIGLGGVLE